jgi:hypothetical protein
MKRQVRVEIKRGPEGQQYTLLDTTLPFDGTSTMVKAHGNVGEKIDVIITTREVPEYEEPAEDGWYKCHSNKCDRMFRKWEGVWYLYTSTLPAHKQTWMTLCECEADCVGGKGLRKVG